MIIDAIDNEGKPTKRYDSMARYIDPSNAKLYEKLIAMRKEYILFRDEMLAAQKSANSDRKSAKFFKEEANSAMRMIRAITLHLPYFGIGDKNKESIRMDLWPLDLNKELDFVGAVLSLVE